MKGGLGPGGTVITVVVVLAVLVGTGWYLMSSGLIPTKQQVPEKPSIPTSPTEPSSEKDLKPLEVVKTCDASQRATFLGGAVDALNGSTIAANAETWTKDNEQVGAETNVNAKATSLSTNIPMNFEGYVMVGNDNFESGTDRGSEYFYQKILVPDIGCTGSKTLKDFKMPVEGTPTWTGYDDGTVESTTNITIGAGSTVTSVELKMQAADDQYLGNPAFSKPLGVCFNVTTPATWDEIKVQGHAGTFKAPGFLNGKNVIGDCYILNTGALKDASSYKYGVTLKSAAGQDPTAGSEVIDAIPVDYCYYKDDDGVWATGWGDESSIGSDTDCGMASDGSTLKQIWVN